jgi:hypothetical protein
MEVVIDNSTFALERVELSLAQDECAELSLGLATGGPTPPRAQLLQWAHSSTPGVLRWGGHELPFLTTGFDLPRQAGAEIHGAAVSAPLWDWFTGRPEGATPLLVYQRQEADPNAWAFVRRLAGFQLAEPEGDFADRVEPVFAERACFPRRRGDDNLDFLNRLIAFLDSYVPGVVGWCAFGAEQQPVRLITLPGRVVELDASWEAAGDRYRRRRPGRHPLAANWYARRSLHPRDPAGLFAALCRLGRPASAAELGQLEPAGEATQVVPLPGVVVWRGLRLFCSRAEYGFTVGGPPVVTATLRFGADRPAARLPQTAGATGSFLDWVGEGPAAGKFLRVKPAGGRWAVLPDRGTVVDPERPLWVEPLTPVPGPLPFAGLHCTYPVGAALRLTLEPGEAPQLRGSPQRRHRSLEQSAVTLNCPSIDLRTGEPGAGAEEADGLRLDGPGRSAVVRTARGKNRATVTGEDGVHLTRNFSVEGCMKVHGRRGR